MVLLRVFIAGALMFGASTAWANLQNISVLYSRGDYPGAASAAFQLYSSSQNIQEKLNAGFFLARSLQALDLPYSASRFYGAIVRQGPVSNPFFRQSFEQLGQINSTVSLGQAQIVQLVTGRNGGINPEAIPGSARGFYFYYQGVENFEGRKYEAATRAFRSVPGGSPYYLRAQFHLGVIANLQGQHSQAISYFSSVASGSRRDDDGEHIRNAAIMNIARVEYETKRFNESLMQYGRVARDSDLWLDAQFEGSWAFFMIQKHNNALGNLHTVLAPFFENRFYPESYILQSITFLRLCRFDETKEALEKFKDRYQPLFGELKKLISEYDENKRGFYKLVYDFRSGALSRYREAWPLFDALSRTDAFREGAIAVRNSDSELARLSRYGVKWSSSGLQEELREFLGKKKAVAADEAGRKLYQKLSKQRDYLKELSRQTEFINAEMLLNRVDALRASLRVTTADKRINFIGGFQTLNLSQELEYWPFQGEYWEDELGYYVYNLDSSCPTTGKK
jgi:hypothetical protein